MPSENLTLTGFLRAMPKVEIHCHLFGTVRYATFVALAERNRAPLERAEIDGFYTRGEKPVGVLRVLRALDAHLITCPDDLYGITREYLEDASGHGLRYSEFFWNPTGTVRDSRIPYGAAQPAIIAAMRDAETDFAIVSRLIPSIDREAGPEAAVEMVDWVTAQRVPETIGIGIDYREPEHPPELFWKAYRAARRAGLKTPAHAGEFGMPWTNVETALDLLDVDRIDHGYTVLDNPALTRRCAERGIVFTVVPTNSHYLRTLPLERWAAEHPIRDMPRPRLPTHPTTDHPPPPPSTPTRPCHTPLHPF